MADTPTIVLGPEDGARRASLSSENPDPISNEGEHDKLLGLRRFMDDWKIESNTQERIRKEEEKRVNVPRDMAAIHLDYLEDAIREDKELIGRWTETLNILLTFGGLLSSTITAFLLSVQPEMQASPFYTTNKLLLQILQSVDDTAVLPIDSTPSMETLKVLSWWHASLACSLASASGALLAKQWVIHYESRPLWANSAEIQCQLREVRYQGLARWQFYAILELLPFLLQISLVFFAIGLAHYVHPTPELFTISLTFIAVIGAFYIFTLIAGTYFPSAPFKSPVTHFVCRTTGTIIFWAISIFYYLGFSLLALVLYIRQGAGSTDVHQVLEAAGALLVYSANSNLGATLESEYGEQSLVKKDSSAAVGVLCSRLQRHLGATDPPVKGLEVGAEAVMSLPPEIGANIFRHRETFQLWCVAVVERLKRDPPLPPSYLIDVDILCHIAHYFPDSPNPVRVAVLSDDSQKIAGEENASEHLTKALRRAWSSQDGEEFAGLPVLSMRPTTIAVYLRFHLSYWCLKDPEDRLYGDFLMDELPTLLESGHLQGIRCTAVVDAVTLVAMVLVQDNVPGVLPVTVFLDGNTSEQLINALHHLSHYSPEHTPCMLIPLAVEALRKTLEFNNDFYLRSTRCSGWKNGQFVEALFKLLRLGCAWWQQETGAWSDGNPGAVLVHQVRLFLVLLADNDIQSSAPPEASFLSTGLEVTFATFAHPSAPSSLPLSVALSALRLLSYTIGLRYEQHSTESFPSLMFRRRRLFGSPTSRFSPLPIALLHRSPQILRQLIYTIENSSENVELMSMVLSIMVKGREVFFPSAFLPTTAENERLLRDLESLAGKVLRTSNDLDGPDEEAVSCFANSWPALAFALKEVERSLLADEDVREISVSETKTLETDTPEWNPRLSFDAESSIPLLALDSSARSTAVSHHGLSRELS